MIKARPPRAGGGYVREPDGSLRRLSPVDEEEASLKRPNRRSFAEAVDETLADQQLGAAAVLDRLKEALGAGSDAELAWIFGTSPQSLSNRRNRNSVPYREAVFVALLTRVSLDYLLTGRSSAPETA